MSDIHNIQGEIAKKLREVAEGAYYSVNSADEYDEFLATDDDYLEEAGAILALFTTELEKNDLGARLDELEEAMAHSIDSEPWTYLRRRQLELKGLSAGDGKDTE